MYTTRTCLFHHQRDQYTITHISIGQPTRTGVQIDRDHRKRISHVCCMLLGVFVVVGVYPRSEQHILLCWMDWGELMLKITKHIYIYIYRWVQNIGECSFTTIIYVWSMQNSTNNININAMNICIFYLCIKTLIIKIR